VEDVVRIVGTAGALSSLVGIAAVHMIGSVALVTGVVRVAAAVFMLVGTGIAVGTARAAVA